MAERMIAARRAGLVAADGSPVKATTKPRLARRMVLISLTIPPRRQPPGLTSLDKT
jgi:hypothetical protein